MWLSLMCVTPLTPHERSVQSSQRSTTSMIAPTMSPHEPTFLHQSKRLLATRSRKRLRTKTPFRSSSCSLLRRSNRLRSKKWRISNSPSRNDTPLSMQEKTLSNSQLISARMREVFLEIEENLPVSEQRKHRKTASLLRDENVSIRIHQWLLRTSKVHRTPDKLCHWIHESLLVEMTRSAITSKISARTVTRWMYTIGYKFGMWKKGVFIDGHEQADVMIEYRNEEFLIRMLSRFKSTMQWWEGDFMETAFGQECALESEIVWVSHDESIFYLNDDGGKGWSCF